MSSHKRSQTKAIHRDKSRRKARKLGKAETMQEVDAPFGTKSDPMEQYLGNPLERTDMARAFFYFVNDSFTVDENNVARWKKTGKGVPADIVAQWVEMEFVTPAVADATAQFRDSEWNRIAAEYAEAKKNRTPEQIAEEHAEMRAAFGPGEEVVDLVTGEVVRT